MLSTVNAKSLNRLHLDPTNHNKAYRERNKQNQLSLYLVLFQSYKLKIQKYYKVYAYIYLYICIFFICMYQ